MPEVICVAEGYATAASIFEATGYPVAVAFSAGNLLLVAEDLRRQHPEAQIILCADNDISKGNPGLTAARAAAEAVLGWQATPDQHGDFNDCAQTHGLGTVRRAVDCCVPVNPPPLSPEAARKQRRATAELVELSTQLEAAEQHVAGLRRRLAGETSIHAALPAWDALGRAYGAVDGARARLVTHLVAEGVLCI